MLPRPVPRCATLLFMALAGVAGQPQAAAEKQKPASNDPHSPLLEFFGSPSWLELGVDYRARYETQDVRYRIGEEGGDQQLAHRTRLRFGIRRVLDPLRFVFELEDSRVSLTDAGSTVNAGHVRKLGVLQLQAKLVSESLFGRNLRSELQFGRLTMDLGRRRLVAANTFRNTTNRFDGIGWLLARPDKWEMRSFVVQPVLYSLPDLNRGRRRGHFWGLYYQGLKPAGLKHDFYYLHLRENRDALFQRQRYLKTFGARLHATPSDGGWQYEIETAWQFGRTGGLDHFAHLQNAEAGYRWSSAWKPLLLFQYSYSSGDRDPFDSRNSSFDPLFGTRRFELAPSGIYGLIASSNLNSPAWRVAVMPARPVELVFVHRIAWLAQNRDEWNGRIDVAGRSGSHIGHHWEAVLHWKALSNLDFEVCYVRFSPGAFVRNQAPAGARASNYLYLMNEIHF